MVLRRLLFVGADMVSGAARAWLARFAATMLPRLGVYFLYGDIWAFCALHAVADLAAVALGRL